MDIRTDPEFLRHTPAAAARGPGAQALATLAGIEALIRGVLLSVYPLVLYSVLGDGAVVSQVYLATGVVSLVMALALPVLNRILPRRWLYTLATLFYLAGAICGILGGMWSLASLLLVTLGTVTGLVCLNAYIMDHIARADLGRIESMRLFYSASAWTVGPLGGVALWQIWAPLPFVVAAVFSVVLLAVFWKLRMGNGKVIVRAKGPAPNPLAFLGRFAAQPRLVLGWIFAVVRSCGWWAYIVYLPIYAIESGLPEWVGGAGVSASSAMLFAAPLLLRWVQRGSVRRAVRTGFAGVGIGFLLATLIPWPWASVFVLLAGSAFLIVLDIAGGLPFMMAVKPGERSEMAAVYSTFRDASGIITPGLGVLILMVAPVQAIFAVTGVAMLGMVALAGKLHPMLGIAPIQRPRRRSPAA